MFDVRTSTRNIPTERRQDAVVLVLSVGFYIVVGLFEILTNPIKPIALSTAVPWAFGIAVIPTVIVLLVYLVTSLINNRLVGWAFYAAAYFFVLNYFYERFAEFIIPV